MLKEFVAHIQETAQPIVKEVDGKTFIINRDGTATEILPEIFHPDTLPLNSLDALAKLVKTEAAKKNQIPDLHHDSQPSDCPLLYPAGSGGAAVPPDLL